MIGVDTDALVAEMPEDLQGAFDPHVLGLGRQYIHRRCGAGWHFAKRDTVSGAHFEALRRHHLEMCPPSPLPRPTFVAPPARTSKRKAVPGQISMDQLEESLADHEPAGFGRE